MKLTRTMECYVMKSKIFLFGEAEKGEFGNPIACRSLPELFEALGNPPTESLGISYAIQTLHYQEDLLFCRVQEEGFSVGDYLKGFSVLRKKDLHHPVQAIVIPGVGDAKIIEAATDVCSLHKSLLVLTEKDLYDYLTNG